MNTTLKIKNITPLHIGDGKELDMKNTVYRDGELHILKQDRIFDYIADDIEFKKAVEKGDVEKIIKLTEKPFSGKVRNDDINYSIKYPYQDAKMKVKQFIKERNKVFIPGSSLKGAIRTAVFYKAISENERLYKDMESELLRLKEKFDGSNRNFISRELEKVEKRIEKRVFTMQMSSNRYKVSLGDDTKDDILKYLIVGHSDYKEADMLSIGEIETLNMRSGKDNIEKCEMIEEEAEFRFNIKIEKVVQEKIKTKKIEINNVLALDEAEIKRYILSAVYKFNTDILENELKYSRYREEAKKEIKYLLEENTNENPLIRLGKYKGFLSNTISLILRKRNEKLYDDFLRKFSGKTNYPYIKVRELYPKTRRLSDEMTLGWCKIEEWEEKNI